MSDLKTTKLASISKAIIYTMPIYLGYVPIGFAYGVLALKTGLSPVNTILMSIIVFAGSAQFVAVGLFALGLTPISVIVTTFIVNLRHLLMSASLSMFFKNWNKLQKALFSFHLTDETFVLHSVKFPKSKYSKTEIFTTNITTQLSWVIGTILGVLASELITDIKPFALDYALAAMFMGLLIIQLKNYFQLLVAIFSGFLAVWFLLLGLDKWNVILAIIFSATVGVLVEEWIKN